jgi:phage tail sheath protein FI
MANAGKTQEPGTPSGGFIQEFPRMPPSIESVQTALPVFVGYTQLATKISENDLLGFPWLIENLLEYEQYFGGPFPETGINVAMDDTQDPASVLSVRLDEKTRSNYLMYYSILMYFANGGNSCYILAIGLYNADNQMINPSDYYATDGTFCPVLEDFDDITLVICPDTMGIPHTFPSPDAGDQAYYFLQSAVIHHCAVMQNRLAIIDVYLVDGYTKLEHILALRNQDGHTNGLQVTPGLNYSFGAVYFPRIQTSLSPSITNMMTGVVDDSLVKVTLKSAGSTVFTLRSLKKRPGQLYNEALNSINRIQMLLPAAPAIAGVYAQVDNNSGVWKSPANLGINNAVGLEFSINDQEQGSLNVDEDSGFSVNAIRGFTGRGPVIIWGARTLAGNDNEWRYISVRRFLITVEQSIKKSMMSFVFEPNDQNTWTKLKMLISNYLTQFWRMGALMGDSSNNAFFVHLGLGETMTQSDISEGKMIIQIGLAPITPAEFIIIEIVQLMSAS